MNNLIFLNQVSKNAVFKGVANNFSLGVPHQEYYFFLLQSSILNITNVKNNKKKNWVCL